VIQTIGTVAHELGVSVDTVRRWERENRIPKARRLNARRVYSQEDLKRIRESLETSDAEHTIE